MEHADVAAQVLMAEGEEKQLSEAGAHVADDV